MRATWDYQNSRLVRKQQPADSTANVVAPHVIC